MTETALSRRWIVLTLVALALFPRVLVLQRSLSSLDRDVDDYLRLADNVANWATFGSYDKPTAFRPPLYPMLLVPFYWFESKRAGSANWHVIGIATLHVALGVATVLLTDRLGRRYGLGRWSIVASVIVALDPLLIHHTRLPMSEVFSAFLLIAALYCMSHERRESTGASVAAGVFLGLGMLCRPTVWAFVALWLAAELALPLWSKQCSRARWPWMGRVVLIALGLQLPWAVRNWVVLGRPILTTTHGGYTLLLGNNPVYYDRVVGPAPFDAWSRESLNQWQSQLRIRAALDGVRTELEYDEYCYREAWRTIASRPGYFFKSVALRVYFFWSMMPRATEEYSREVRLASAVFYLPVFFLGCAGLVSRRAWQWPVVLLPAALASFTLVHALYWSDMRMRAPVMPAAALLAAWGADWMWHAWTHARARDASP